MKYRSFVPGGGVLNSLTIPLFLLRVTNVLFEHQNIDTDTVCDIKMHANRIENKGFL